MQSFHQGLCSLGLDMSHASMPRPDSGHSGHSESALHYLTAHYSALHHLHRGAQSLYGTVKFASVPSRLTQIHYEGLQVTL
jgi:hypothetical protein